MIRKITALILVFLLSLSTISYAFIDTSNAISAAVNTPVTGKVRYQTERIIYAVKSPSKGTVRLKFEYPKDAAENSWRMILLSSTYQLINEKTSSADEITGETRTHITKQCRLNSGTFYVMICGFRNYDTSPYTLTVLHESESQIPTESEFKNSTPFNTPILKTNMGYLGNLSNEFDIDYFCIRKPETGNSVTVSVIPQTTDSDDSWHLELYDKLLRKFATSDAVGDDVLTLDLSEYKYDLIFLKVTKGTKYTNNDYKITFNLK